MTREEAIGILDAVIPPPEHHTVDLDHLPIAQAWKCIKKTLTAEPIWIPCSEMSPEEDGRYLVIRYDYVTKSSFVDILWYEKRTWWNRHSTGDYAVTAWMSLPKPYKADEVKE